MIGALLLAATAIWVPVGVTASRLRVFVDRTSVRDVGRLRHARIRIGSPGVITGRIVLVYQDEEIDCGARSWRLVGYDARDTDDRVVKRAAPLPDGPMLTAPPATIGGEVVATVCAFGPAGSRRMDSH